MKSKEKILIALSAAALFAATFLCWLLLELIYVINIDDIMYAGWTEHGIKYFFERNIWHYFNFNGRAFIHLMLQLTLIFEEHLYAIVYPLFISGSTYILTLVAKKQWTVYQRLFACALSTLIFISLGKNVLTNAAMWMAGGFNYVFPLIAVTACYWLFLRFRQKTKAMLYLLPLAFLCGATTEQYGMYTIGLIVMTYFFDAIDNKKLDFRGFAYLAAAISGMLTILLAPPTLTRLDNTKRSLLSGIDYNWKFLGGSDSDVIFPILFMLLVGILAIFRRTKTDENGEKIKYRLYSPLLISGIPFAVTAYVFTLFKNYTVSEVLTYIFVILTAVTMLLKKETRELGKIIVCGFGTFFMMSITWIAEYRTCVPCILSFVIVLSIMFIDTLSEFSKKTVSGTIALALSGACAFGYFPAFSAYKEESKFSKGVYEQYENADETGVIEIDWDKSLYVKNTRYRNKTMTDMYPFYPLKYFQEKYDIPDNVKYVIRSEKETVYNVCCDGLYYYIPAIVRTGSIFVPFMLPHIEELQSTEFLPTMLYDKNGKFTGIEANGKAIYCPKYDILQIGSVYFVRLDYVIEQWNYDVVLDQEENTLFFTSKAIEN